MDYASVETLVGYRGGEPLGATGRILERAVVVLPEEEESKPIREQWLVMALQAAGTSPLK